MFLYNLHQSVYIAVSNERGEVKGRAEYTANENSYFVHYKAADGRATSAWFGESDLLAH